MSEEVSGGAICGGVNTKYRARVRRRGFQRYELVGKWSRSYRIALRRMTEAFLSGDFQRGDVIMIADYYDPEIICELKKV